MRPLMTMVVFTIVFGRLAGLPSGDMPYAVMVFAAMLPWQFFSSTFQRAGNSLVSNSPLVSKVYFPRLIIPCTSAVVGLVDFLISFGMLLLLMMFFGISPDWKIIFLPGLLGIVVLTSLGAGFFVSALNVKYRDFSHLVPFIIQFGLFISPVGYNSSIVPDTWRFLYSLNPMAGVIDGFRWIVSGDSSGMFWPGFVFSILLAAGLFGGGIRFFMRSERYFADVI